MKKILTLAIGMLLLGSAMAQSNIDYRKSWREFNHKRDISNRHLSSKYAVAPQTATKSAAKWQGSAALPEQRWFPGEWEEVQAIVVTLGYTYLVPGHESDQTWTADPVVGGIADYYQYQNGWQQRGSGPYTSVIDFTSNFGKTFLYLIDGIQLGGAEAWVRIEKGEDSIAVKHVLEQMNLRRDHVRFIIGSGNSFWYRDCGPICFYYGDQDSVAQLDFMYYPGRALDDSLPSLIEAQMGIPNYMTSIEWEGGNCVVDGAGMVLSSDAIYSNNMDNVGQLSWDGVNTSTINYTSKERLTQAQVFDSLAALMGPRACYIIPTFKYDGGTGHVDLYCDMWDENEFVFSKFTEAYSNWRDYATAARNIDSLSSYMSVFNKNYKKHFIPFPCTDNGGAFSSQSNYNSRYTRTYSNHTFVNNVILQPVFSAVGADGRPTAAWDRARFDSIKTAYPGYTLYPIDVREFDGSGGAIHCITKQIPADNPIRILHPSYTSMQNSLYGQNVEMTAIVTNRSGIDSVSLTWRSDNGEWSTIVMNLQDSAANTWAGNMDLSAITHNDGSYNTIEYYISATSNNGKTITKPMTAAQGGYYTFYMGENVPVNINTVTFDQTIGEFYPNPSHEQANIQIEMPNTQAMNVSIIDMAGRSVYHTNLQADGTIIYTLNASHLAKGIYNVVFSCSEGNVVRRLIVE